MKITLLLVGKTDKGWIKDGYEVYAGRLSHYVPFQTVELPELKNVSAFSQDQIKEKEGEMILRNVKDSDKVVLMDERGKEFTSIEFSREIEQEMQRGRNLVFVIGGAYGFSKPVYDRSDAKISLSRMTFSHQMVRTIFVEQLYRAFSIINGEPYHHE